MKHDLQQKPSRIFVRLDEARAALQVKFSPSGQQAVSLVGDDSIRVWDLASETQVQRVNTPTRVGWGDTVQFSPDGRKLLLTQGARAFILDAVSGQRGFHLGWRRVPDEYGHHGVLRRDGGVAAASLDSSTG